MGKKVQMRSLRVVIADGGAVPRSDLLHLSERAGFELLGEATSWPAVVDLVTSRSGELVLVSGNPDFAAGVTALDGRVASVIVAPDAQATKEYADCGAFAVLTPDAQPEMLASTAWVAVSRAADLAAARKEIGDLRDMLETRKLVERAKGVLMRRLGIPEDVAYRRMQKASQDENRKMRDIAESILSAERLYGPGEEPPNTPL